MSKKNTGFGLVEIIIASAVMVVVVLAVMNAFSAYVKTSKNNIDSVKAAYLAEEGVEAVKILRDTSWNQKISPLAIGTVFHLSWNGTTWATSSVDTLIDNKFHRNIYLHNAYRNSASKKFEATGDIDSNARRVVVDVYWSENGATTTKTMETYITNLFEN